MLPPNDYLAMKDYELNRLPDVLARAEQNRLLREAGLMRGPSAHLRCGSPARCAGRSGGWDACWRPQASDWNAAMQPMMPSPA